MEKMIKEGVWSRGERIGLDELKSLQLKLLKWSLRYALRVSTIRRKWDDCRAMVWSIQALEEIEKPPFMTVEGMTELFSKTIY